jgi:hypothetical protein
MKCRDTRKSQHRDFHNIYVLHTKIQPRNEERINRWDIEHTPRKVRNPQARRPLGRCRSECKDNIKIALKERGCQLDLSASSEGPLASFFMEV